MSDSNSAASAAAPAPAPGIKNHNKYRKEKPWDHEGIEHWKIDEWKPEHMKAPLLDESSFATLFPQYREKYLREVWPLVTSELGVSRAAPLAVRALCRGVHAVCAGGACAVVQLTNKRGVK